MRISKYTKKTIIFWTKFLLLFFILLFLSLTFLAPLTSLAEVSVILIIFYLMISLIYFAYKANKEERKILLNMWKVYFSVLTILLIFFYSTEEKLRWFVIDYYKTKINYELKIKSNDVNNTFMEYENIVISHIKNNQKKDINMSIYNNKEDIKKENFYTIWYGNLAVNFMNVITLFMLLWFISEFEIQPTKKEKRYIEKKYNKS